MPLFVPGRSLVTRSGIIFYKITKAIIGFASLFFYIQRISRLRLNGIELFVGLVYKTHQLPQQKSGNNQRDQEQTAKKRHPKV